MISPHFPPDTNAGAHRVRLLAPHLPAFGWEPTVLTVDPSAYEGHLDPDLARLVPPALRVVRAPAWSANATRGLGIGDLGLRSLTGLRRMADALLGQERFDALFITIYPSYPAVLGPGLKRRHRLPFVLDYQDPWVGSWGRDVGGGPGGTPDIKSRIARALAERLEPRVARAADAITAVSARTYEDVLARIPGATPRVCSAIPLGFETGDIEFLRRNARPNPHFTSTDGLRHICYVGTLLPMGIDVLRAVLTGLARVRDRAPDAYGRIRLHFFGTSNQRNAQAPARVLPIARELGVADVVSEIAPRLDYLDALNVQVQADALLLLGSSEPHYTPSKVFPALLAGRPLLALYHAASPVVELLHGRAGTTTLTFDGGQASLDGAIPGVADAFERMASAAPQPPIPVHTSALRQWSSESLAGRLAGVLDAVA